MPQPTTPTFQSGHILADQLIGAWFSLDHNTSIIKDYAHGHDLTWIERTDPDPYIASPGGLAVKFTFTGYGSENTIDGPTTSCTVAIRVCALNASDFNATFSSQSQGIAEILAHVPYNNIVYWDFGGNNAPNRITWTPPTEFFGAGVWHDMIFIAGTQGSKIISDGVTVASHSTPITRQGGIAYGMPGWNLGWYGGAGGLRSTNRLEFCYLYGKEWGSAEIAAFNSDPYAMFSVTSAANFLSGLGKANDFPTNYSA